MHSWGIHRRAASEGSLGYLQRDAERTHYIPAEGFLGALRQIKGFVIAPVNGTYCVQEFFFDWEDQAAYGPYESETAFNAGLKGALEVKWRNTWVVRIMRPMLKHGTRFTRDGLVP